MYVYVCTLLLSLEIITKRKTPKAKKRRNSCS